MILPKGHVGASSPREHETSAVHGPALPCLSRGHACTHARAATLLTPADTHLHAKGQGLIYKNL